MRIRSLAELCLPAFIFVSACASGESDPSGTGGTTGAGGTGAAGTSGSAGNGGGAGSSGVAGTTGTGGSASGTAGTGQRDGLGGDWRQRDGTGGTGGSATGTGGSATGRGGRGRWRQRGQRRRRGRPRRRNGGSGGARRRRGGAAGTTAGQRLGRRHAAGAVGVARAPGRVRHAEADRHAGHRHGRQLGRLQGRRHVLVRHYNDSQISNYNMLQAAGGQYTFYLWTGRSQATNQIWKTAKADGHEIGNHTKSHDSNGQCNATDVMAGGTFIQSTFGAPAQTFAAPNGSTCFKTPASQFYFINRGLAGVARAANGNSDPLNLNCYIPATGQAASVFNGNIDTARAWAAG